MAGYGLVILILHPPVKLLLAQLFRKKFNLGSEILVTCFTLPVIATASFLYHAWFIKQQLNWAHWPMFTMYCLLTWSLPAFFLVYTKFRKAPAAKAEKAVMEISGQSRYENFTFNNSDIVYLKSTGNYVQIFYKKEGAVRSEIVRSTFGKVREQLPEQDFAAIHRSYIVNTKNFDRVIRSGTSFLLVNQSLDLSLPVSKTYLDTIKTRFTDRT
jgi:DNA-binding LytR/AlgR family response regulator